MPLPREWIDRLFARMFGLYGNEWVRMWESGQELSDGHDLGVEAAKEVWGQELGGFRDHPDRIAHAIAACAHRPRPPNVAEFRALCAQAPAERPPALDAPRADPEKARAAIAGILTITGAADPLAWAKSPKSHLAMDNILRGARRGERRLCDILCEHVRNDHPFVDDEMRAFAGAHATADDKGGGDPGSITNETT